MTDALKIADPSSDAFDPYFKWLGIPPEDQPPTHYRLLAIPPFTADPEVIENAADQRMAHLKSVQAGKRGAFSQALLDQIAQAKVCLLDQDQKTAYDEWLRSSQAPPVAPPLVHFEAEPPIVDQEEVDTSSPTNSSRKASSLTMELVKIVLGGIAGLAVGYLVICWISPRNDFLGIFAKNHTTAETRPEPSPVVSAKTNPKQVDPVVETGKTKKHPSESVPTITAPKQTPEPVVVAPLPADKQAALAAERDAAIGKGDLVAALRTVSELAALSGKGKLDEQLSLLSTWNVESPATRREVAAQLAKLLEQAIAESRFDLTARYVDQLLVLARSLDDQQLERRATLIALKRPAEPSETPSSTSPPAAVVTTTPSLVQSPASTIAKATTDDGWKKLITNLDTFKLHWKSGDNRGTYLYDDQANAIVIDSPYKLGTISDSQPWSEFYFEIAAKQLCLDRLDIQINGVTFKVGPTVKQFPNGTPVKIVFVEDKSQAIAIVGDDVASRVTITDDKWRNDFQCHFSSDGGHNAQIKLSNIRLRRPSIK